MASKKGPVSLAKELKNNTETMMKEKKMDAIDTQKEGFQVLYEIAKQLLFAFLLIIVMSFIPSDFLTSSLGEVRHFSLLEQYCFGALAVLLNIPSILPVIFSEEHSRNLSVVPFTSLFKYAVSLKILELLNFSQVVIFNVMILSLISSFVFMAFFKRKRPHLMHIPLPLFLIISTNFLGETIPWMTLMLLCLVSLLYICRIMKKNKEERGSLLSYQFYNALLPNVIFPLAYISIRFMTLLKGSL